MALLALSKGQLLIHIYKMCKEYDMMDMYDKKYLKYSIEELASEYITIENYIKNHKITQIKPKEKNKYQF